MFARPMRVSAAQLSLRVTPGGANVEFEQTWSSATYRDVGVKRLVIIPTREAPRIAREEMQSSVTAGPEARPATGDLLLVHRDGLILSATPDTSWASTPARLKTPGRVVTREVDENRLPAALRTWKGRSVRAFSADGSECVAEVAGFSLRAEVVPHFGMEQHWRGELGQPPADPQEIANEVWDLAANGGRVVIGRLEPPCSGSLWALPQEKTLPIIARDAPAAPELRDAVLRSFRASRNHQQIQKEFVAGGREQHQLWDMSEPDALRLFVFAAPGKPPVVTVSAKAGTGCGDFYGALSAVFVARAAGKPQLELVDEPSALEPLAVFDLDGDGSFEILFAPEPASDERSLWRSRAKGGSLMELFAIPNLDCPC